jgi:intracellular multiplication protein IcmO
MSQAFHNRLKNQQIYRNPQQNAMSGLLALFQGGTPPIWVFAIFPVFMTLIVPTFAALFVPYSKLAEMEPLAGYALMITLFAYLFMWPSFMYRLKFPITKPMVLGGADWNTPKAGADGQEGQFEDAEGITYMGHVVSGPDIGRPVWLSNMQTRAHLFILGTTGAGKTQQILGFAWNALIQGSGFIMIDGKADSSTTWLVYAMAWLAGREDDIRIINFTTGDQTIWDKPASKISNTINLFSKGNPSTLASILTGIMGDKPGGDNKIWYDRAVTLIDAMMGPLVYMRDYYGMVLSTSAIREHMDLPACKRMYKKIFMVEGQKVFAKDMPDRVLTPLKMYLTNLPGWKEDPPEGAASNPMVQAAPDEESKQHGYVTMQLLRGLSSLSDNFGHITGADVSEVDWSDAILNRRIVLVMLPSLEKSPADLEILGKINLMGHKMVLASLLGSQLAKNESEEILSRITDADHPFYLIYDEKASYMVEGEEDILAQARSLGISVLVGSQDYPRLEEKSKAGAKAIASCTSFKAFMCLRDVDSIKFAQDLASDVHVARLQSYESGGMMGGHAGSVDVVEKVNAIDSREIQAQPSGIMTVLTRGDLVKMSAAYYAWPKLTAFRMPFCLPLRKSAMEHQRKGEVKQTKAPAPLDTVVREAFPGAQTTHNPQTVPPQPATAVPPTPKTRLPAPDLKQILEGILQSMNTGQQQTSPAPELGDNHGGIFADDHSDIFKEG